MEASEPTITVDKVTVNITSNVSDKRNAVLIVASYENGVMKNISVSDETEIGANGTVTLETNAPTTDEYKIMVWDSLNNMKPILRALNNHNR